MFTKALKWVGAHGFEPRTLPTCQSGCAEPAELCALFFFVKNYFNKKAFTNKSQRLFFRVGAHGFEPRTLPTCQSGCTEPAELCALIF